MIISDQPSLVEVVVTSIVKAIIWTLLAPLKAAAWLLKKATKKRRPIKKRRRGLPAATLRARKRTKAGLRPKLTLVQ